MKIALLIQSFENGGVQRIMINLYNGFIEKGYNAQLLVAEATGEMINNVILKENIYNLNTNHFHGDYKFLFSINKIKKYIEKERPTVIVASPGFASISLIIANIFCKYKTKIIAIVDNKISLLKKGKLKHKISYYIYKYFLHRADAIVAAHDNAKNDILNNVKISNDKVYRIYHPLIPRDIYKENSLKVGWLNENNMVFLSVGRLVKEKNYDVLIKAFKIVLDSNVYEKNKLKLIILGDGCEKNALKNIINSLKLEENVLLYGYSNQPFEFMKRANIYVSSSKQEAFGNVIVEALACGMKIVSTDCESGGPREILCNGKYGILCEVNNINSLANAMINSIKSEYNKDLNIKRGNEFLIETSVSQYLNLIKKVSE